MSRSRKKTPIIAITTAASDKRFKTAEHRRERAAVKIAIGQGLEPPSPRQYGDPWKGDKDGKQYLGEGSTPIRK